MDSFSFPSQIDGWTIHGYRWPRPDATGAIVIAHGMAEHALRYERFAGALNAAGYDAWAVDHRGHGKTLGPAGFGDFGSGGFDALVDDLDQLVDRAIAENPGLPIVLFGHSMGAAAAQQYAQVGSGKLTALILSGSTLRDPGQAVGPYNAAFEPARTAYDWLSRDPNEVDRYIADPLCGFDKQTVHNGFDRTDGRRVDPARIACIRPDLPVMLVAGDADPVNDHLAGIDYLESMWRAGGVQRIDRRIYSGGRHEMLNETNRDEVTRDIVDWLEAMCSSTTRTSFHGE